MADDTWASHVLVTVAVAVALPEGVTPAGTGCRLLAKEEVLRELVPIGQSAPYHQRAASTGGPGAPPDRLVARVFAPTEGGPE